MTKEQPILDREYSKSQINREDLTITDCKTNAVNFDVGLADR